MTFCVAWAILCSLRFHDSTLSLLPRMAQCGSSSRSGRSACLTFEACGRPAVLLPRKFVTTFRLFSLSLLKVPRLDLLIWNVKIVLQSEVCLNDCRLITFLRFEFRLIWDWTLWLYDNWLVFIKLEVRHPAASLII